MGFPRRRVLVLAGGAAALLVVLATVVVCRNLILEAWYMRQLRSADPPTRGAAALALARIGAVRAIPTLLDAFREPHPDARPFNPFYLNSGPRHFEEALKTLTIPKALPILRQVLRDHDRNLRYWAVGALGELGVEARAALPDLEESLGDPCIAVSVSAVYARYKIDPDGEGSVSVQRLIDFLNSEDLDALFLAKSYLAELDATAIPRLISALETGDSHLKKNAAEVLGQKPLKEEAIPALRNALNDPDLEVREAAAQALGLNSGGPGVRVRFNPRGRG